MVTSSYPADGGDIACHHWRSYGSCETAQAKRAGNRSAELLRPALLKLDLGISIPPAAAEYIDSVLG